MQAVPGGYQVQAFAEQTAVSAEDVVELWTREGVLRPERAVQRTDEILLIASDSAGDPVGVCTTYLAPHDQLRTELWHTRLFVAAAHRQSHLAVALALIARDTLAQRFVEGDRRGIGIIFNVESELLKRPLPQADWPRTRFVFIGQNEHGDHVRVFYFPGALAPEPAQGSA
jgi:hypothetical protein